MPPVAVVSKRVVYLVLLLLILLSIAFRYPFVTHERNQSDSYFIHGLSSDILSDGHATWTFHPLSYFGLYPLSYPSGVPFLCSELSMATGVSIEGCILLIGFSLGILFCVGAFCLIRCFVRSSEYVLLGTFFCITGARFIDSTYWVGSGRAPVAIFLIITILVFIMANSRKNVILYCIGVIFLIVSFTLHHMAILIMLFSIAYVIVMIGKYISLLDHGKASRLRATYYMAVSLLILYVGFVATEFFYTVAKMNLSGSSLFDLDSSTASIVLNSGVVFTRQIGFIFPIAVVGVPFVAAASWKKARETEVLTILFSLLVFVPLIGYSIYISTLLSPFVAVICVMWIQGRYKRRGDHSLLKTGVIALIAVSLLLPAWTIDEWNSSTYRSGDRVEVDSQVFSDAAYLGDLRREGNVISNVNSLQVLLFSVSSTPFIGGGIYAVLYGEINESDVAQYVGGSNVGFPKNMYVWYEYNGPIVGDIFRRNLMILGVDYFHSPNPMSNDYLSDNSHLIVAIDNNWPSSYVTSFETLRSTFAEEVKESLTDADSVPIDASDTFKSYCAYCSSRTSYYLVQVSIEPS